MEKSVPNIVIFASGSGSNAENIINWAQNRKTYRVTAVLCNRKDAFVLTRAERLGVPHYTFTASEFRSNTLVYKGESRKLTDVLHELGLYHPGRIPAESPRIPYRGMAGTDTQHPSCPAAFIRRQRYVR